MNLKNRATVWRGAECLGDYIGSWGSEYTSAVGQDGTPRAYRNDTVEIRLHAAPLAANSEGPHAIH